MIVLGEFCCIDFGVSRSEYFMHEVCGFPLSPYPPLTLPHSLGNDTYNHSSSIVLWNDIHLHEATEKSHKLHLVPRTIVYPSCIAKSLCTVREVSGDGTCTCVCTWTTNWTHVRGMVVTPSLLRGALRGEEIVSPLQMTAREEGKSIQPRGNTLSHLHLWPDQTTPCMPCFQTSVAVQEEGCRLHIACIDPTLQSTSLWSKWRHIRTPWD